MHHQSHKYLLAVWPGISGPATKVFPKKKVAGALAMDMAKTSLLSLWFLLLLLLWLPLQPSSSSSTSLNSSVLLGDTNCKNISYPFGVSGWSTSVPGFEVNCSATGNPALVIGNSVSVDILEISVEEGYVRVGTRAVGLACGGRGEKKSSAAGTPLIDLEGTPYTISHTRNKYTVLGCDAMAFFHDSHGHTSGCASFCTGEQRTAGRSCPGVGCCQIPIPQGLKHVTVDLYSIRNLTTHSLNITSTGCNEAFLVDQDYNSFPDLRSLNGDTIRPVVLEWAILNGTCNGESSRLVCKENSYCYNTTNGAGYRCNCSAGYAGNPYQQGGCTDIDECIDQKKNNCSDQKKICVNKAGGFDCRCPHGIRGVDCKRDTYIELGLGIGLGSLVLILTGGVWIYCGLDNRKLEKLKHKHFLQNGGLLLRRHISSRESIARIFTTEELERATDNFSESKIVGRGGYGTVYRGVLPDEQVVAVKKSRFVDESQIEQFINEVVVISKINHRNVVKLLGCCLETDVPLLVYEFISNGTLFQHLHEKNNTSPVITWGNRLRIAVETAGALAYLHCKASVPIIHRDVKSANILLDDNYTAKVSDFGASRLVPLNQTHVTTIVQGTIGYLDPEYFHTSQLTEKSDVYSFGVVLLELLTSEKPISFCRTEMEKNLASHFLEYIADRQLRNFVDRKLVGEAGAMQLFAIAEVAKRCLSLKGEERPTMKEVFVELNALRRLMMKHAQDQGAICLQELPALDTTTGSDLPQCTMETRLLS